MLALFLTKFHLYLEIVKILNTAATKFLFLLCATPNELNFISFFGKIL